MGGMDMQSKKAAIDHLDHVSYPATKEELVKACDNMSDVPEEGKKWFMDNLPGGTYQNSGDVRAALRM